jgi:hypothetical protein
MYKNKWFDMGSDTYRLIENTKPWVVYITFDYTKARWFYELQLLDKLNKAKYPEYKDSKGWSNLNMAKLAAEKEAARRLLELHKWYNPITWWRKLRELVNQ